MTKNINLGHGIYIRGSRLYRQTWVNGKNKLILLSWIQRRCRICQRFLGKHQLYYCSRKHNVLGWNRTRTTEYRRVHG